MDELEAALQAEVLRFSERNGYIAEHFADARCECGSQRFTLHEEETQGCAIRVCTRCGVDHFIGDTEQVLSDCEGFTQRTCRCGAAELLILCAVALYDGSDDVRWLYVGAGCPVCRLVGVYVEWKVEGGDYRPFIAREGARREPPRHR